MPSTNQNKGRIRRFLADAIGAALIFGTLFIIYSIG
jgi:hypothetical protein